MVEADAPPESASSIQFDRDKLGRRPRTQKSDSLRQVPGLMVSQTVNNLLDSEWREWREPQFAEESRVMPMAEPVEQLRFTPGIPLTTTATAPLQLVTRVCPCASCDR